MSKKKKSDTVKKLDITKLGHSKLLNYTESLHKTLETESLRRSMAETERDRLNAFLTIKKEEQTKRELESRNQAQEHAQRIEEQEKISRQMSALMIYENKIALDELRQEKHSALKDLTEDSNKRLNEMARLMADEKQVLRDKDLQRQDWMKHQESTLIRKIKANTDIVEKKATDVMADIKNMYQGFDRDIEIKHTREIEQFEKNHIEEHMRIVEKCAKQIDHERNAFESQRKEQEKLNEEMTIKLPILKDENQRLKKISERLLEDNLALEKERPEQEDRARCLERKMINYDTYVRVVNAYKKQIPRLEERYRQKCEENEVLASKNAKMKELFEKYNDYVAELLGHNGGKRPCLNV